MSEEGFFRRWARLKSAGGDAAPAEAPPAPHPAPAVVSGPAPAPPAKSASESAAQSGTAPAAPLPTLEDAARLTLDSDFSAFVARGVDKSVQRLALKKLFADPHFNMIDGLDIYMNDYNKASPLTPTMLASLKHAPSLLSRLLDDQQAASDAAAAQAGQPARELEHGQADELVHEQALEHARAPDSAPPSTQQGNA